MTRSLRSDHDNVNIFGRYDLTEVDVEAVSKCECLTCCKVGLDALLVKVSLSFIVDEDHDDVSLSCCLCRCVYFKTCSLSLCPCHPSI